MKAHAIIANNLLIKAYLDLLCRMVTSIDWVLRHLEKRIKTDFLR